MPQGTPPIPPLEPRDATLLSSYLALRGDLFALAEKHTLPADELLAWAASPAVAPRLAAIKALAQDALDFRTIRARTTALETLESIAKTSPDPIEQRRAAATILRAPGPAKTTQPGDSSPDQPAQADPSKPAADQPAQPRDRRPQPAAAAPSRSTNPSPRASAQPHDTSADPEPYGLPSPSIPLRNVGQVVGRCVSAPSDPGALATLFAFAAPTATLCGQPFPSDLEGFLDAYDASPLGQAGDALHAEPCDTTEGDTEATFKIALLHKSGEVTGIAFALTRSPEGPHPNAWLLASLNPWVPGGNPARAQPAAAAANTS